MKKNSNRNTQLHANWFFPIFGMILISLNPIIIVGRPSTLDTYIFACMTCNIAAIIFFPLFLIERNGIKKNFNTDLLDSKEYYSKMHGWKKNIRFLTCLGIIFGVGRIFFFLGYDLAGAMLAALTNKARIILALGFGVLFLNENISKKQIFFSAFLFFGLIIVVSQGVFNLLEFNLGVIILLIVGAIWTLAHTLTKPLIERKEATPIFLVFTRSTIGGIILLSTYFLFYPIENLSYFYSATNWIYFLASGFIHGFGLFCWFKTISYMEFTKATVLYAPTPIITALFAFFLLGEIFTLYDLLGTVIVVFSIIMIVGKKNDNKKK